MMSNRPICKISANSAASPSLTVILSLTPASTAVRSATDNIVGDESSKVT